MWSEIDTQGGCAFLNLFMYSCRGAQNPSDRHESIEYNSRVYWE